MNNDSNICENKWTKYGKLLSGLIHNLNTPLMGLSGRLELLQMKFDDEKSFKQINTQLDRINSMLTSIGYLLDKEQADSKRMFDLNTFLNNFFTFMSTDMRYKHGTEKELIINDCMVSVVPNELIFIIYSSVDYLLNFVNDESNIRIENKIEESKTIITINLILDESITDIPDLNTLKSKAFTELLINKYYIKFENDKTNFKIKFSIELAID
ncbi:MAG: hypothetical protein PHY08_09395 [Candidatus Cloacimonetes bacterium]|nr:hypothetical protein [Candidatus Cloacimonadota bacterium]